MVSITIVGEVVVVEGVEVVVETIVVVVVKDSSSNLYLLML